MSDVGNRFPWTPKAGASTLGLYDRKNQVIDSVNFEVRGPSED
jgi:hypothetical protein